MSVLEGCKPQKVFEFFELLCSVPHGSGNTGPISGLCVDFARERGLQVRRDGHNNVVIVREAAPGREKAPTVILQGHLDMVCASEAGCGIDMARDGLRLCRDGDWLSAYHTSLGGDNCIAVAMIMAVLDDAGLSTPRLEAVLTTDEESGMDGAIGLDMTGLQGRFLVNLDSEEEGTLTVSCAGGVGIDCFLPAERAAPPEGFAYRELEIGGLSGGHSGVDIDKGRASAIKLMGRFLHHASLEMDLRIADIAGGTFTNVIPSQCRAVAALPESETARFDALAVRYDEIYKAEFGAADPGVSLSCAQTDFNGCCGRGDSDNILFLLLEAPFGVEAMSADIKGLVQTSSNPGVASMTGEGMRLGISVRSSVASQKDMLCERVTALCRRVGADSALVNDYPGWSYRRESALRDAMADSCRRVLGREPVISATHGGLECGLFMEKRPELDCVSLGPELLEVHSVRERLSIASTERLYAIVVDFLENWKGCQRAL